MPIADIVVKTDIQNTFRVNQLKSMFDLPVEKKLQQDWHIELPIENFKWNIGLIVGPSGSGKTTIGKKLFPQYHKGFKWEKNAAIVDCFSKDHTTPQIIEMLNSVGFSSPPSWLKPFAVLSSGEKFRAELARALIEYKGCFVIDEFTSVVDRGVAKVGSYAVSKAIRKNDKQMIALSCHYDIKKWLEPDWTYDLLTNKFTRRRLRRPKIKAEIRKIERDMWNIFAQYHYLSGHIHRAAQCFGLFYNDSAIGFCGVLPSVGRKGMKRVHRLVILPDYQGVGFGKALLNSVAEFYRREGIRVTITSSHPSVIKGLSRSTDWRNTNFYKNGSMPHSGKRGGRLPSGQPSTGGGGRPGVLLASFEYMSSQQ